MNNAVTSAAALAAALLLVACSGGEPDDQPQSGGSQETTTPAPGGAPATPGPAAAPAGAQAPPAFAQCRSCHAIEPGKNGVGPSLAGIVGKPAAGVQGFRYSDALRKSGITWTRETLDTWLAAPMKMVPGTRMVQMVRDEAQRKAIIDYLETLP